jgi:hypothetical protein
MDVEERAADQQTREHVVEVMLVSGEKIRSRLGPDEGLARAELAGLHGRLQQDLFLRVGEDTIVRAEEVRWLQLRPHDQNENDQSLVSTLITKVRGGDEMGNYETQRTQHNQGGGGLSPWIGYGRRPYSETKPFFLTSEFLAFAGMLAALLITLGVSDSLNGFRGWLLPTILTSAYIISRGIAKSGERDPNPDHGRQSQGMQYGQQGGYSQGSYTDGPMARESQNDPYGRVPR